MRIASLAVAVLMSVGCGGGGNPGPVGPSTGGAGGAPSTPAGGAGSGQGGTAGAAAEAGALNVAGSSVGGTNSVPAAGCPTDGSACAVMPVGDSITWGVTDIGVGHGGYRVPLFHLANQGSRMLTFVGSFNDTTQQGATAPAMVDNVPFPGNHEGHPGWVIQQINDIIAASIQANHPRIVLLMIGTNDIAANFDPPTAPQRLGALLDTMSKTDPSLTVVVAQIIPSQDDALNPKIQAYNGAMATVIKARTDAGQHVRLVDMYSAFSQNAAYKTALLQNTLHPNDAGYAKMADAWFAGVSDLLPKRP